MNFADPLLTWFDAHQRDMPWRYAPHQTPDPYKIWLSEMMLQQTTVSTVKDYFTRFVARWPSLQALSRASVDDVLHAWQGLGYYNRAHNLYKCAHIVVSAYDGIFPCTSEELIKLPGIGPYASAAIAAIAFNQRAFVIDGNVERVLARLFCLDFPPKTNRVVLEVKLDELLTTPRHGDFAQAMMELGAEICKPKNPACDKCPVSTMCAAFAQKNVEDFPRKALKKKRPQKYAIAYVITNDQGDILFRKRPDQGLLKGLIEVPTTAWVEEKDEIHGACDLPVVKHVFTHFDLEIQPVTVKDNYPEYLTEGGYFVNKNEVKDLALPTLMKKILAVAFS